MSGDLVGRVAAQPKTVYRGRRDRWTPRRIIEGLDVTFTIDVAASAKNGELFGGAP